MHWLRKGAQPTERVQKLLKISGAWDEFKGNAPATPARRRGDGCGRGRGRSRGCGGRIMSDDDDDTYDEAPTTTATDYNRKDANLIERATAAAVLEYLAKSVVDDPDAVEVDSIEAGGAP